MSTPRGGSLIALVLIAASIAAAATQPTAADIVKESVRNTQADWAQAPKFNFIEKDVITKSGTETVKTYHVWMIDGSPYNELTRTGGHPLSAEAAAKEQRKLQDEIARRRKESPSDRQRRVAEYQRERRQDNALLMEMFRAFDFRLTGEDTVNGRKCYVLEATPKPGYQPVNRDTQVLKGMRGKMWVDVNQLRWVKVQAKVFRPVAFGLFIAHVYPGTEFTLEQLPVAGNVWQPSHFFTRVNARILIWARKSTDDETYSGYSTGSPRHQGM